MSEEERHARGRRCDGSHNRSSGYRCSTSSSRKRIVLFVAVFSCVNWVRTRFNHVLLWNQAAGCFAIYFTGVSCQQNGEHQQQSQLIVYLSMLYLELYSQRGDNLRSGEKVFKEKDMWRSATILSCMLIKKCVLNRSCVLLWMWSWDNSTCVVHYVCTKWAVRVAE